MGKTCKALVVSSLMPQERLWYPSSVSPPFHDPACLDNVPGGRPTVGINAARIEADGGRAMPVGHDLCSHHRGPRHLDEVWALSWDRQNGHSGLDSFDADDLSTCCRLVMTW